jgi:O-antigen ligase
MAARKMNQSVSKWYSATNGGTIKVARTFGWLQKVGFGLVSIVYVRSVLAGTGVDGIQGCLLLGAGIVLGMSSGRWSIYPFIVLVPLLCGLNQTLLISVRCPSSIVFVGLWWGIHVRDLVWISEGGCGRVPIVGSLIVAIRRSIAREKFAQKAVAGKSANAVPSGLWSLCLLGVSVLSFRILWSLCWQLCQAWELKGWHSLSEWGMIYGYGDPLYFSTSAFVWLQGFSFMALLLEAPAFGLRLGERWTLGSLTLSEIEFIIEIYALIILTFFFIEFRFHLPEGWVGGWIRGIEGGNAYRAGFQSPFEDISSFGSVASVVFLFELASITRSNVWIFVRKIACIVGVGALVVASYSRGAWLATLLGSIAIVMLRGTANLRMLCLAALSSAVVWVNITKDSPMWSERPYLARFASLARLENIQNRDGGRIRLYKKAIRMIESRPFTGFGIGSFYGTGVRFAEKADPKGDIPDFAHNSVLQFAAELGVLSAGILLAVWGIALVYGVKGLIAASTSKQGGRTHRYAMLGLLVGVLSYEWTQMTANSLNVYESNQYIFWFLNACLIGLGARWDSERVA